MSEMTAVELAIFFLVPVIVVIGVKMLFVTGALGPDHDQQASA
jgi:hypothetical protein